MMRCPHTLHLSAVCWNPEYWEGDTGSRMLCDKGALAAQPASTSWPQVSMRLRRVPAPAPTQGTSQGTALTHQEVLLAVHFLTHVVECLPTKSSPCKDEGREEGLWATGTRDDVSATISQHPPPTDEKWTADKFLNFPLMLCYYHYTN